MAKYRRTNFIVDMTDNHFLEGNLVCCFVCVDSGFRRVLEDQLPRLIAKIKESFPKFAENEKFIQKIVDIVNSCIYDERLVSVVSSLASKLNTTQQLSLCFEACELLCNWKNLCAYATHRFKS